MPSSGEQDSKVKSYAETLAKLEASAARSERPARTTERSGKPVLLGFEADAIKAANPGDLQRALVDAGVRKLLRAGILWPLGGEEAGVLFFLQDTGPKLSVLEKDVVRLQVDSYLAGAPYSSLLLSAQEIVDTEDRLRSAGHFSRDNLIVYAEALAAERDDDLDKKAGF